MPTKRQRRTRPRLVDMPPALVEFMRSGRCDDEWKQLQFFQSPDYVGEAWTLAREAIMAEWIEAHPGTRPWAWWRFDAPREPVEGHAGTPWSHAPQRQRLGGQGRPLHEALAYAPEFALGIPVRFLDAEMVHFYHNRMGSTRLAYADALDPDDPPQFESQAAYLKRHDLLEPGEGRRIPVEAFEPEVVNTGQPIADPRM